MRYVKLIQRVKIHNSFLQLTVKNCFLLSFQAFLGSSTPEQGCLEFYDSRGYNNLRLSSEQNTKTPASSGLRHAPH